MSGLDAIRNRLVTQGASLATIDAFEAAIRKAEDATVARILRASAGDDESMLGSHDEATLREAAREIETLR